MEEADQASGEPSLRSYIFHFAKWLAGRVVAFDQWLGQGKIFCPGYATPCYHPWNRQREDGMCEGCFAIKRYDLWALSLW